MAEIFISFIHEEERIASGLQKFLQTQVSNRRDVFLSSDRWAIHAGEQWLDRIIVELRKARVVVSLLSPKSVKRPWVNFEAGAAWIKPETALIPVCFDGLTKGKMPKPYSSLQAIQLEDFNDQYYLVTSVLHYLGEMAPPPPPPLFVDSQVPSISKAQQPYRDLQEVLKRYQSETGAKSRKRISPSD